MYKENNKIGFPTRVKELFIDWLVISAYLVCLFIVCILFYKLALKGIPEFTQIQSQIIVFVSSVLPIILFFTYLDYNGGSIGKRKMGLKLAYKNKKYSSALFRNIIKFLPWQLGHMGIIRGMYTSFDTISIVLEVLSVVLMLVLFFMGTIRNDKRHLGDLIAGTQVLIEK
ncbi:MULTISPECIES: RDD family protein [Lactobacillales]|uniref:RDD family protein n=1 Tax=Lactobacillales TaxID=186826 RepID=UPI000C75BDE8|nr:MULTISPECIES: RDD family protein [Lactobacillales]MBW7791390.1 RDD family protein [Enterococcus faecalis]NSS37830.1 RDD family protein [Enterococcus faecalis]PLA96622.1 RDD family protein [Enterococcus faecalis]HBC4274724.1 RDD family protein [Enterococcus faecalis]HBC4445128.1 RDD family protein [Enterococcus faecalis]